MHILDDWIKCSSLFCSHVPYDYVQIYVTFNQIWKSEEFLCLYNNFLKKEIFDTIIVIVFGI